MHVKKKIPSSRRKHGQATCHNNLSEGALNLLAFRM